MNSERFVGEVYLYKIYNFHGLGNLLKSFSFENDSQLLFLYNEGNQRVPNKKKLLKDHSNIHIYYTQPDVEGKRRVGIDFEATSL